MTLEQWETIRHFKPTENWGDPIRMSYDLLTRMDQWADYIETQVIVDCGTQGTHATNSEHYVGEAADVIVPGLSLLDAFFSAARFGFKSIGVYPDWQFNGAKVGGLHLGVRFKPYMAQWLGIKDNGKQVYIGLSAANLKKYGGL